MHVTISRTTRSGRTVGALLVAGAVLLLGGAIGGAAERAALLPTNGFYEPMKTLPVSAYSGYYFPHVVNNQLTSALLDIFVVVAIVGAVTLVATVCWRTARRAAVTR